MEPKQLKVMIGVLIFAAVAIPVYWIVWFADSSLLAISNEPSYFVYENAFPLADGWITLCAALGAWKLIRRKPSAVIWVPAAGATSIFLSLMDLLFGLENGTFKALNGDVGGVVIECLVIALTFAGGAYGLLFAWKNRAWLASLT